MAKKKIKNELEGIKREDMIHVESSGSKVKKGFYIGYSTRIVIYSIMFLIFSVFSFYLFNKSLVVQEAERITYSEKSNIDYKVKVKKNSFYDTEYLDKNMSYVANLIDSIDIDYNYIFNSNTKLTGDFDYTVVATLEILNSDNKEVFFKKNYALSKNIIKSLKDDNELIINKNVVIDYDKYNDIAKKFITQYGVTTDSNLKVSLIVDRNINDDVVKNNELDASSRLLVTIPLSEKALSIKLDSNDIDNNNTILSSTAFKIENTYFIAVSVLGLIIALIFLAKIVGLLNVLSVKDVKYDKYIKKLFREYDRLIVRSMDMPDLNDYDVTHVKSFNELLDVRDNLSKPICFYEVTPHAKCHFYVKADGELFIFTVKNVDLEND